ncbi:hypothetical protein K1T71_014580 [Dendrolimus kikuchii]|uniref:Uncharacterized protein n=1 Tax=Dendrolimus kikuchii TaxID=765133 RepID=A0ACC1CET9_9NEOP|nr:hypothetical protein K1T71_014580 [Dendrolimus kikuchii]
MPKEETYFKSTMYTRYLILLFLAVARCQQADNLDSNLKALFQTKLNEQQNRTICLTSDKQVGECVPYYFCTSQVKNIAVTNADGLIGDEVIHENNCPSYLQTCCSMNYISTTPKPNINQTEINECGDGSDDTGDVCDPKNDSYPAVPSAPNSECILPPYPEHGSYVANIRNAKPGQNYDSFQINVTCNRGYGVVGDASMVCFVGGLITKMPECVPICKLNKHASVEYYCLVYGDITGTRICNQYEPSNTQVLPECKRPNYYSHNYLPQMRCIEGSWNYVATCEAECGRITPRATKLVIGGKLAKRGEMPWHAGIYTKTTNPYRQICGGTLVSTTVVISAAHCFWVDDGETGQLPASQFAVALGKLYRPWNDPADIGSQKFDVKDIKLPIKFRGNAANFQEDIALVTLSVEVELQTHIRPVCLSFDPYFNQRQLQHQNLGKVAGWGLTSEDGDASPILKVVDLPYVDAIKCQEQIPGNFLEYITSDKICAGYANVITVCARISKEYLRNVSGHANSNRWLADSSTFGVRCCVFKQ